MSEMPLVDIAYQAMHHKLLNGIYLPGMLLSESELAEELGMSRTPVRAAVSLLEKEGFVQTLKKKGILVKGIEIDELFDIFDLLDALYTFALDQIEHYGHELDMDAFRRYYDAIMLASQEKQNRHYYESGLLFMRTLLETLGNRSILETFDRYRDKLLYCVVAYRSTAGSNRPYTGKRLYSELLKLLSERNFKEARRFMLEFRRGSQEEVLRNRQALT